jgi:hypothetical protein
MSEPAAGLQDAGASSIVQVAEPKFPARYIKIGDMDVKIIEALKMDLSKTTHEWVKHGGEAAMIGIPWHTLPGCGRLRSIWNGQDVNRIKASPAWFALRAAILKRNPWMNMWDDPLGSINLLKVLKGHKSQEHLDGPDGHLTLVFRLQGLATVSVWTNRRKPNQLSTAKKAPGKTYRLLPLQANQAYAIDACRVAHFAGYSEGEMLAIWRIGLSMDAFRRGQEREALASPHQLNAEASAKWEGVKALVMPSFEEFTAELEALSEECEDVEVSELKEDRGSLTMVEHEGAAPVVLAGGATLENSKQDGNEQGFEEFAVNEAAPHSEETKYVVVMAEAQDREEVEAKGPALDAPGALSVVGAEAKFEDPRGPAEANPIQYDRTWSTRFEPECPAGYTLSSQEEGCPVVFKTNRSNGNSYLHLEFEPCKLPVGHRDRVRVKFRTRSLRGTGMSCSCSLLE